MTITVPTDAVVVLDVDDTLYLERSYVRSGFEAVGRHLCATRGLADVGDRLWADFRSGVRGDAFDRALRHHGVEPQPELIAELIDIYRTHRPAIELLGDARRALLALAPRPIAIITDGPATSQWAKVGALGLGDVADPILVTADLGEGKGKPDPLAYRMVEEHFAVAGDRCWYIGDNPAKDFIAPLERGWSAVRVRRDRSLHHDVGTPPAVMEIVDLDELQG